MSLNNLYIDKLNFVDPGAYFAHLFIDCHLAYIARVRPGMMTGSGLSSFLSCSRLFQYNSFISLTLYCMDCFNF